jgi:hypothetical protein
VRYCSAVSDPSVDDLLARLERERLEADRLYNEALTAVDRAIQTVPALPPPPAAYDPSQLARLNDHWQLLPDGPPPIDRSLKGRLRALVWRIVGPPLERQQQFNAALVDHLNRNVASRHAITHAVAALLAALERELAALARFESRLVQYLQTITAYVDTRDRSVGGPELRERLALTEHRPRPSRAAWTRSSTSASRTGSAAPATTSPGAWPTTCRSSRPRRT